MNDEELRDYLKRFCFGREHLICSRDLVRQKMCIRDSAICAHLVDAARLALYVPEDDDDEDIY